MHWHPAPRRLKAVQVFARVFICRYMQTDELARGESFLRETSRWRETDVSPCGSHTLLDDLKSTVTSSHTTSAGHLKWPGMRTAIGLAQYFALVSCLLSWLVSLEECWLVSCEVVSCGTKGCWHNMAQWTGFEPLRASQPRPLVLTSGASNSRPPGCHPDPDRWHRDRRYPLAPRQWCRHRCHERQRPGHH